MGSEASIYLVSRRVLRFNIARLILVELLAVPFIIALIVQGLLLMSSDLSVGFLLLIAGFGAGAGLLAGLSWIAVHLLRLSIEIDLKARTIKGNIGAGIGRSVSFDQASRMDLRRIPLIGYVYLEGPMATPMGPVDRKARRYLYVGGRVDGSRHPLAEVLPKPLGSLGSDYVSIPRATFSDGFRLATLRSVGRWWWCRSEPIPPGPWLDRYSEVHDHPHREGWPREGR